VIEAIGPFALAPTPEDVFPALLKSIVSQQLRTQVAATIHGRVVAALGGELTPRRLQRTDDASLRGAGLSGAKLAAMRDLAEKCASGVVPPRKHLEKLPDHEIIERLVEVRGIGVWSAQMFLMFRLGRPDVLPVGDFGIRKAFGRLYRKSARLPPERVVERHGRAWAPYRTVASWYLWRSLDGPAA